MMIMFFFVIIINYDESIYKSIYVVICLDQRGLCYGKRCCHGNWSMTSVGVLTTRWQGVNFMLTNDSLNIFFRNTFIY